MYRIFRHYVPKTLLMLGAAEALVLLVSVYIGVALRAMEAGSRSPAGLEGPLFPKAVVFAAVMLGVMVAMGLYRRDLREGPAAVLVRLTLSFAVGLVAMFLVYLLDPALFVGNGAFAIALMASFVGIASCRFLCMAPTDSRLRRRTLVLGVGDKAQRIASLRRRTDRHGVTIVGFVDLGVERPAVGAEWVFSARGKLRELVERHGVDEIVIALDDRRNKLPLDEILECRMLGVRVLEESDFFERQLGKVRLEALQPSSVVFCDGFSQAAAKCAAKRLFDVLASLCLLLLAAPVMLLTAAAIFVESGAPILYRQTRVGKGGRPFEILKFRSMRVDAEANGAVWASANDARVTRVGRFIRKTRIDELPQLFNVLKGEMSFVGPRPERPEFVAELARVIPYYSLRHYVKPGITGWAQICYPYGASVADAREKLQYDLYYLKNHSLFLDFTILLHTVHVVLWGKGSR